MRFFRGTEELVSSVSCRSIFSKNCIRVKAKLFFGRMTVVKSTHLLFIKHCLLEVAILLSMAFYPGSGYFAVDGNLPSETILP